MRDSVLKAADRRDPSALRNRPSGRAGHGHAQGSTPSRESAVLTFPEPFAARFRDLMETAPVAAWVKDADGRYMYANPSLLATMGKRMGSDWYGKTDAEMWSPKAAVMIREHDFAALAGDGPQIFTHVIRLEDGPHTVLLAAFALPDGDARIGVGGIGVDLTEYSKNMADRGRLSTAIEQVAESVMITDRDARITYVNPAFERVTGYSSDEVIGQNPRLLSSGRQTPWFYVAMWAALTRGLPWTADLVNRRKDGSLFTEEAVISPIRDPMGEISSYIAVKRDVTRERALVERSTQFAEERALIGETIRNLRADDSPEATAQAICCQVVNLTGVVAAQLLLFGLDGRARPIGFVVGGQPDPPLRRLEAQRSQDLRERAAQGPWIEAWVDRPSHPYNQLMNRLGVRAVAYAPVRHDQRLIGLLAIDAEGSVEEVAVAEVMPALVEFADLAGALIGRDVAERAEAGRGLDHIQGIIDHLAFQPVFQPIVDLGLDVDVGYEALTRFTDGTSPEVAFAEADTVDLGTELETATLKAALAAAEMLPKSAWLNLNASPGLIIAGEPLRSLLRGCDRHLVLEVTEHTVIADYAAFRAAVAALGPNVELAVDDAGAGFSSLRHILELRPAFVKLDRWLVADLESDTARQAMIVGLRHFSRSTGCRLIAEGIETDRELAVLRSLDIQLGQGYLLGRPVPVAALQPGSPSSANREKVRLVSR